MKKRSSSAVLMCGAFFLFVCIPVCFGQQTQKKVEPLLQPQVPQKTLKQTPPSVQEQKKDTGRPKTILPDLTVVGSLRMIRGIGVTQLRTGGEWWFSLSFSFDVENRADAPCGRFEAWLVSEMVSGSMIGIQLPGTGRGIKHSLNAHERRTYEGTYLFPPEYAERTVRVRAYIDALNETTEADESNNSSDWFDIRLPNPLPDLEVSILSILSPTAGNRNPSTGRLEGSGAPESLIPVYVSMICSVVVRNNGLAPARPVRVEMDAEGYAPGHYRRFG